MTVFDVFGVLEAYVPHDVVIPYDGFFLGFMAMLLLCAAFVFWGVFQLWTEDRAFRRDVDRERARREAQQEWTRELSQF
jgi:hypothetical protein